MNEPCHELSADRCSDHESPSSGRYKSRGGVAVARCLDQYGIPYLYEHPVAVIDQGKTRIWYPDFQLRGHGILIEYGGRLDDPDYATGWERKKRVYAANGLSAIMLRRQDLSLGWSDRLFERIEQLLMSRVQAMRTARKRHEGHGACRDH